MKVSIIVPVYNSSKYLKSCLDSLVNQTLDEIEIIAIDDCSTDNSLDILREYEDRFPNKIKVFHNDKNLGQSATRNRGISVATGEYIGFLDSDDYVNFDMYKTMYEGAKEHDYPEVITTGLCFVKDDSYLNDNFRLFSRKAGNTYNVLDNPKQILDESPSVCNKLFRKDTINNNIFLEGRMWEDVAFSFSKMFNADKILRFRNQDYFYRRRQDEGVSSKGYSLNPHLSDIYAVADQIEKETRESKRFDILENEIRFIQLTTSLQRVVEVMSWNIPDTEKEHLCKMMISLIIKKYGDFRKLPEEELSSRIGILELDKIKALTEDMPVEVKDIDNEIDMIQKK